MNTSFKQTLKAKAHHLKPVVLLGAKGLTPSVVEEAEVAINAHELIKVKIGGTEKDVRQDIANSLCEQLRAELVQIIGTIAIIYRKKVE